MLTVLLLLLAALCSQTYAGPGCHLYKRLCCDTCNKSKWDFCKDSRPDCYHDPPKPKCYPKGKYCKKTSQCCPGLHCIDYYCDYKKPKCIYDYKPGCKYDYDCCSKGYKCSYGKCVPPKPKCIYDYKRGCKYDYDCCTKSYKCSYGKCVPPKPKCYDYGYKGCNHYNKKCCDGLQCKKKCTGYGYRHKSCYRYCDYY